MASVQSAKVDLEVLVDKFKKFGASSQEFEMLPELETKLAQEKKILEAHHKDYTDNEIMLRQVDWHLKTLEARLQQVLEQKAAD
ncbi:unnamed protein product [Prunus armeniaca]|uniref:Uncharacterized protein n=1 Tax=Prunus armeniaca TaxID=36596 RepID=A0A6J5UCH0_PRUAR|nr:unnamed protein product [Prunus armeniaca]